MIDQIYLDLDGVITDFDKGWQKVFAVEVDSMKTSYWDEPYDITGCTPEEFWGWIDNTEGFWENLEFTPESKQLLELLEPYKPVLVTTPSPNGAGGKQWWIKKHLPEYFHDGRYFIGGRKETLAAPTKLLIDDNDVNCSRFVNHGGQALLVPRPWNCALDIARDGETLQYVTAWIFQMETKGHLIRRD